jgi:hypothetical protein
LAVLTAGGWVFYNANVLNEFVTPKNLEARRARAERLYKKFENLAQPKIVAADIVADLYPTATPRGYHLRGTYTLKNETTRPLDSVYLSYEPSRSLWQRFSLGRPAQVVLADSVAGVRLYRRLAAPDLRAGLPRPRLHLAHQGQRRIRLGQHLTRRPAHGQRHLPRPVEYQHRLPGEQ